MNKKGQGLGNMGLIIGIFVLAIFGVVLTVSIADIISVQTSSIAINNETLTNNVTGFQNATDINTSMIFNLTNAPWEVGSFIVTNGTGSTLVLGTDYSVDFTLAAINFSNTSSVYGNAELFNNVNANYSFFSANFINDSISRTFINLIVLFFVLGLILMILGKTKEFEIMNMGKK
ncbi:hypothetical protein LCGC14_2447700 [marine sediment metagenome]|uniref:Uncharacterized protein n=1 Tax=marine sediment metagenome TaxID=412755 RepID=A0A0F9BHD3_9ZZZZ